MTEVKKPTPAQRVKELEADIKKLEASILKLTDYTATHGNEQYTLGYNEGLADGLAQMKAAVQAQSVIGRFFSR
jgi:hypothetical protein